MISYLLKRKESPEYISRIDFKNIGHNVMFDIDLTTNIDDALRSNNLLFISHLITLMTDIDLFRSKYYKIVKVTDEKPGEPTWREVET